MNEQEGVSAQEKHQIWVKNSGYLYDKLVVHKMKWPSLTFQWLPTCDEAPDSTVYEVVVATHTSGKRDDQFINIYQIQFPNAKGLDDPDPHMRPTVVKKVEQLRHQIEPNRVRYSELNPEILAVRVDGAPISIFKRGAQFPLALLADQIFEPGFALQWSRRGLISGDHSGNIALWPDVEQKPMKFTYSCEVEDTKCVSENVFVTAGDDGCMCVWDVRSGRVQTKVPASEKQIYSVAVNPVNPNLILTAGQDATVRLWDARSYSSRLYKFESHEKAVLNVQWSPKTPTIFASGGQDGKVKIWDLLRVGFEIPKDNSGTEQLLFTHEGHQHDVLDLGWNPHCMLLGSTQEENNTMQIYEIANCIQDLQYTEDMDYLREQCLS